jgi:dolichol-phosphate mannosyltransferase
MLSLVIPVYNEVESLRELLGEITAVGATLDRPIEVVFVDDGSKDGSWKLIQTLSQEDNRVRGIRFRRNFGKAAALRAGFNAARGDYVMTLDADLQDDPHEIPRFFEMLEQDLDVVSGYKQTRHDPWHKVWPSRVFNKMVSWMTGVKLHDHNCGMKLYRSEVLGEVRLYGELHRFVPVLAAARGFRVGEIVVNHRKRRFGYSKYGVRRFVKGFLDLLTVTFITGFGSRPQHVLGSLGLLSFFVGFCGLAYSTAYWLGRTTGLWEGDPLSDRPVLIYSVAALLLGAQFMSIGLVCELITAYQISDADTFSISDRTGFRRITDDTEDDLTATSPGGTSASGN